MNSILSSIMAFLLLLQVLFGIGGVKDVGGFDKNDWMKDISSDKLISEISIPGTHNSGALYEPAYGVAKCQSYTLNDQLNMGVRFLDVRASVSMGKLKIVHGKVNQGTTLSEFIDDCYKFLKTNPSETIIFSLRNENGEEDNTDKFLKLITKEIDSNSDLWYAEGRIPSLKEVRGKLVLMNRFNSDSSLGINAARGWRNNNTFAVYNDGYFVNVQDVYSPSTLQEKKDAVISFFNNNYAPAVVTPALCLNFLNVSADYGNIRSSAAYMNDCFMEFSETNPSFYGCVLFDFVTPTLCETVINAN